MKTKREIMLNAIIRIVPLLAIYFSIATTTVANEVKADKTYQLVCPENKATWDTGVKAWIAEVNKLRSANIKDTEQQTSAMASLIGQAPLLYDWLAQDAGNELQKIIFTADANLEKKVLAKVAAELGREAPSEIGQKFFEEYVKLAAERRQKRLANLQKQSNKLLFTKHPLLGGSHYAYTEALSDAQNECRWRPKSALCTLDLATGKVETLIDDPHGCIRDPDVSFDGKKILFSWKKDLKKDDFHLYEMDYATQKLRQITHGLGFADYEAIYLPGGDILFNSSRCIQTTDCWKTETSSIWRCDKDGKYMRRLGFDQVATNYPQLMSDGRVTFTRWEYNDRGQLYPQPLFQMNQDGTAQTEFYGNNSWFPTSILHARGVPDSHKVIAISSGHHTRQTGKLIVIDNTKGRQENLGVEYLNPRRPSKAVRIDRNDQDGDQYQYPYPFNENDVLVTFLPDAFRQAQVNHYGVYFVNTETSARELLAYDPTNSCSQQIPLQAKPKVQRRASLVDYTQPEGSYFMQDVYIGPGLKDVPRGTIKKLRVVALAFREAYVCGNFNSGPAGAAFVSLPCAIDNGAWDPKMILGETPVYEDGSAFFKVPSRTPVYFQCLDENGHCVQTMRSWSTLMPGESFGCVGCHEDKSETPAPTMINTRAFKAGARPLDSFYGHNRGFSFRKDIQPILDKHCVKCHSKNGKNRNYLLTGEDVSCNQAGRFWTQSYLTLTNFGKANKWVNWISPQSVPTMLPPYHSGATQSQLFKHLKTDKEHQKIKLSREDLEKIAAWIDLLVPFSEDNYESNSFNAQNMSHFRRFYNKRKYSELMERQNVEAYVRDTQGKKDFKMFMPVSFSGPMEGHYRNVCRDPGVRASSNSEYKNRAEFAAANAINGQTENRGHGKNYPSWGPHKVNDAFLQIDFPQEMVIDRVDFFIRANFPHDTHWNKVTLEFSNNEKIELTLEKMAGRQSFAIEPQVTKSVKLVNLTQPDPENLGWAALTEMECYGENASKNLFSAEIVQQNEARKKEAIDLSKSPHPFLLDPSVKPSLDVLKKRNLKYLSASSTHKVVNNVLNLVDGDLETRWVASGSRFPQTITFEFEKPQKISEVHSVWELADTAYRYVIEVSDNDGKDWQTFVSRAENTEKCGKGYTDKVAKPVTAKYARLRILGTSHGWASIFEVEFRGE